MPESKKPTLHPRNKNKVQYDLKALIKVNPDLAKYIKTNKLGIETIDFTNPIAVKLLNKSLLNHYYGIQFWKFPDTNLCPPIPGRADYIHYMADLLGKNDNITCLDIGVGASCIYPILGVSEYNWNFIASDIDRKSIATAKKIVSSNPSLKDKVDFRFQENKNHIFKGIINEDDKIDITICNPPFHASKKGAEKGSMRKVRNLTGKKLKKVQLNFSGMIDEMIYEGGEKKFIQNMIIESVNYAENCLWFSSLVSNERNLNRFYSSLEKYGAKDVKAIHMTTANKISRIVAWTFQSEEKQKQWKKK